jgi:HEAT repeat protein
VLQPGHYSVKVLSPAESARLSFEVAATPPTTLRARVDGLLDELRRGTATRPVVPLLAYTGHSAAIPELVDRLYVPNDGINARVANWLVLFDHEEVLRALRQALKDRGPRSRMISLLVVGLQSRPEDVVPLLLQWLSSPHDGARLAAVEGLFLSNQTKDPKLFAPLVAMLHDPVPEILELAATALGAYQNEAAFKALAPFLADPDRPHGQVVTAMCWIGQGATPGSALHKDALKLLTDVAHGASLVASRAAECVEQDAKRPRP